MAAITQILAFVKFNDCDSCMTSYTYTNMNALIVIPFPVGKGQQNDMSIYYKLVIITYNTIYDEGIARNRVSSEIITPL